MQGFMLFRTNGGLGTGGKSYKQTIILIEAIYSRLYNEILLSTSNVQFHSCEVIGKKNVTMHDRNRIANFRKGRKLAKPSQRVG